MTIRYAIDIDTMYWECLYNDPTLIAAVTNRDYSYTCIFYSATICACLLNASTGCNIDRVRKKTTVLCT